MKVFYKEKTQMYCGYWNNSPIEVGLISKIYKTPATEQEHSHPFREYYVIVEGSGKIKVSGNVLPLEANTVLMIEPNEKHEVVWVNPEDGIRWVIIKEKSDPNGKLISK